MQSYSKQRCTTYVIRSFVDTYLNVLREESLHFEGRALDLKIATPENTNGGGCTVTLQMFAWMAKFHAKFDFVEMKYNHLHVSCRKD